MAEPVANAGTALLSLDCFLGKDEDTNFARPLYLKTLIMALLPIFVVILVYLFWSIVDFVKKADRDSSSIRTKATSSLIVVLFLLHPNLVQTMFKMFK